MPHATRTKPKPAVKNANGGGGRQRSEPPGPSGLPRALALGFLVIILDLWLSQHAGFGISNAGALAGIVAAVGLLPAALEWVLKKRDAEELAERFRQFIRERLDNKVVALLWAVAVTVMLSYSSVEIIGESPADSGAASISPTGNSRKTEEKFGPDLKAAQFHWVATSPFGRRYRVDAPGYISATFPVYPITGLRIALGKDLVPSPSVLFRPSPAILVYLRSAGSRIRISVKHGTRTDSIAGGSGEKSFLIGRAQPIPGDMLHDWEIELAPMSGDATYATTLLGWKRPVILATASSLAPGSTLVADVFSQSGALAGSTEVVLGTDKLVDVEIPEGSAP